MNGVRKTNQLKSQMTFRSMSYRYRRGHAPMSRPAKYASNPGISILQVRRGISIERQYAVPIKYVIAFSVLGKIGILNSAYSHGVSDQRSRRFRQLWILLRYKGQCTTNCFSQ